MQIKYLDVVLRRPGNFVTAHARQDTPEGLKEGTDLLKKRRIATFDTARSIVHYVLGDTVKEINFIEERKEWE